MPWSCRLPRRLVRLHIEIYHDPLPGMDVIFDLLRVFGWRARNGHEAYVIENCLNVRQLDDFGDLLLKRRDDIRRCPGRDDKPNLQF